MDKVGIKPGDKILNKGIIAKDDLKNGTIISKKNLDFARPAKFIHANELNNIIGKKLNKSGRLSCILSILFFVCSTHPFRGIEY